MYSEFQAYVQKKDLPSCFVYGFYRQETKWLNAKEPVNIIGRIDQNIKCRTAFHIALLKAS